VGEETGGAERGQPWDLAFAAFGRVALARAPRSASARRTPKSLVDATRDSTRAVAEWLERARGDSLAATATFMERDMQAILTFGWV
jgi:DNA-binding IclR family transcriptional regulator